MSDKKSPDESVNITTQQALKSRALAPRFYRSDYAEMEKIDIESVRDEWDLMMRDFELDKNRGHFKKNYKYDSQALDSDPELKEEFLDLLVSSITAEYSGCVLYQEIEKNVTNPEVAKVFRFMARDESRHAGFINKALNKLGVAVDLGVLKREKEYTFFKPKFIYYATYLSEKIGYARYITIYRHLERHPEKRFHPIFKWFLEWCNDEFAHGEALALIMRSDPKLLKGFNKLWVRFFLVAVYSTMYVRDHARPKLYEAFGMDVTAFDYTVFDITTEISRQVFPLTLDTNDTRFRDGLEKMRELHELRERLSSQNGITSKFKLTLIGVKTGLTFLRLFLLPVHRNDIPHRVRMQPAW